MDTVLLVDDDILFKAVEGTCLRRERCRLVKTPPDNILEAALSERPDLIVTASTSDASRGELTRLLDAPPLEEIAIIVLEFGGSTLGDEVRAAGRKRPGVFETLTVPTDASGKLDLQAFDGLLDGCIQNSMSWRSRGGDRVPISLPVRCSGEGINVTLRTKNISPSGLFLKTDVSLVPGTMLDVRFTLPVSVLTGTGLESLPNAVRPVPVVARCEVVREVGTGPARQSDQDLIPGLGVRFVDLGDEGRSALSRVAGGIRGSRRQAAPRAAP
jgi:hypothetical protein